MTGSSSTTTTTRSVEQANGLKGRITRLIARIQRLKPVRVLTRFGERRGPLLAAGLSFRALFAIFAALWVGFSIAGIVVSSNRELVDPLIRIIARAVPGLIDTGDGSGAIDPADLFSTELFSWTGAVALVSTLVTVVGSLGAARDAVREIAQLPKLPTNPVLLFLRDLVLGLAFGVGLILAAVLAAAGTSLSAWLLTVLGQDPDSGAGTVAARIVTIALMFALDAGVLAALYRVLAGVPIPRVPLLQGALFGALALAVLQVLGNSLLGGATRNPLLAGFAVIIGLLIWFNLASTVILLGAAWVVVSAEDRGVPLDPRGDRERREQEAKLRAQLESEIREELENDLPPAVRWLARRTRRKRERV
ncbi:MAG: YihY/virulence factor BrkB family protein [Actinomycetales bacterium]|nr:YihY/virulence factor BrkB family protein [Actinomycetales bacterium]